VIDYLNQFFVSPTVSALVGFATLIALILAIYESVRSRRQSRKLEEIGQSLSTRVIGTFPDYLDRLARLISSADNSVLAMCAYPQHGAFSCPDGWSKLEGAIREVIRNDEISVEFIFSSSRVRLENDREQFREAVTDWEEWKSRHEKELSRYFQKNQGGVSSSQYPSVSALASEEEWFDLQEKCEQYALSVWRGWDGNLDIMEVDALMPVFLWVRDSREAIFVMMSYDQSAVSYAFYTCDGGLVRALIALAQRYKNGLARTNQISWSAV